MEPDYGVDVPWVVAGSLVLGVAGVVWLGIALSVSILRPFPLGLGGVVAGGILSGLGGTSAGWILWTSRWGKLRDRDRLLAALNWTGTESLLDVGCGRGLLLLGAAQRADRGRAVGLDIFSSLYESGNRPASTLRNARVLGVDERVRLVSGDARKLPFVPHSFDTVVSRAVLINLRVDAEFRAALEEVVRVTRPSGQVGLVVLDWWRIGRYRDVLSAAGLSFRSESRAAGLLARVLVYNKPSEVSKGRSTAAGFGYL